MTPALTPAQRRALRALTEEETQVYPLGFLGDCDEIGLRILGLAELRYSFPISSGMHVFARLTAAGLELKEQLK